MRTLWKRIVLLGLPVILAAVVLSCEAPQEYQGQMIEPTITKMALDGKSGEVNIGANDGLRGDKPLFAVHGSEVVALLVVAKLHDYSSDVAITQANSTTTKPKVGDRVARTLKDVTCPQNLRARVPRMVPVPHDDNVAIILTGNNTNPTDLQIAVPRADYEKWKKQYEDSKKTGP